MILGAITTYNPDLKKLTKNIESVIKQVDFLIISDNGSSNIQDIYNFCEKYKLILFDNKTNLGITGSLNKILNYAIDNKYDWILTLDQDSVLENNIVSKYRKFIKNNVGIITSYYYDININQDYFWPENVEFIKCDFCITSGSLNNTLALKKIGGFDSKLFIDYVDFDICQTLRENNYEIIKLCTYGFKHEVGKSKIKRIFGKNIILYNENPKRLYYYFRNRKYFIKKHETYINPFKEYLSMYSRAFLIIMFEKQKLSKLKSIVKGLADSRKM